MEQTLNSSTMLTKDESDIIGEVCNISMGSAATALSSILNEKVMITSPDVELATQETINKLQTIPSIGVIINFTSGIHGSNLLIIKKEDVLKIVSQLMGEEVNDDDFGEIHMSAVAEIMNQMMGSSATALSSFLKKEVDISPPDVFKLTEDNQSEALDILTKKLTRQIVVKFNFQVENTFESEIVNIISEEFSDELIGMMLKSYGVQDEDIKSAAITTENPQPIKNRQPEQQRAVSNEAAASYSNVVRVEETARTQVRPVILQSFDEETELSPSEISNFNLIKDVPLDIAVEVGRATKLVKDIIDLSTGSIIELDKQAGDPVDVIVNGQLIARGEVVVIDESFGVRITEILDKKNNSI